MVFLTENEVRSRAPEAGAVFVLGKGERLTPLAVEYAARLHLRVEYGEDPGKAGCGQPEGGCEHETCTCAQEMTHLDANTVVGKNHPSIVIRGKLDTLLSFTVLAQTQFDPKGKLPVLLKRGLAEIHEWIMRTLDAEVGGTACHPGEVAGMDAETLRLVSREPKKYLGLDHVTAEASLGANIALLNWLRALTRETEVTAVACSENMDVVCSLNRLSSALYVLMLLTLAAESGIEISAKKN